MATFQMDNGAVFTYRGSWCAEGLNTSWESAWRAIGTKGTATWDGADEVKAQVPSGEDGLIWPVGDLTIPEPEELRWTGHAGAIREFLDALDAGSTPPTVSRDNIYSLAMSLYAALSADTGQPQQIHLEE